MTPKRKPVLEHLALFSLMLVSGCREESAPATLRTKGVRPAADLLKENRKVLTDKVAYWTGVQRPLVKKLVAAREKQQAVNMDSRLVPIVAALLEATATRCRLNGDMGWAGIYSDLQRKLEAAQPQQ